MEKLTIKPRTDLGTSSSKRIRKSGYVPIVVTSKGNTSSYQLSYQNLQKLVAKGIRESILINMVVDGDTENPDGFEVFIKDYQIDRLNDKIVHMDFFKITRGEKVVTRVPLKFEGTPAGIKAGGVLEIFVDELEIECLPKNLPSEVSLSIAHLEVHDSIRVKDLPALENVEVLLSPDLLVLSVNIPKVKAETVETEEEEAATEETGQQAEPEKE